MYYTYVYMQIQINTNQYIFSYLAIFYAMLDQYKLIHTHTHQYMYNTCQYTSIQTNVKTQR